MTQRVTEPRVKTGEEIREEVMRYIWSLIDEVDGYKNKTSREKLSLLVFSMMNIFDGSACAIGCGLFLVPTCHPADPDTLREEGKNWYPVNEKVENVMQSEISCGDTLHDLFINHPAGQRRPVNKPEPVAARRTKKIRIPIAVDEQGNCYALGWAHAECKEGRGEDYGDMEDQVVEHHHVSWENSKTTVVRWATIEVPLPEPSTEIEGTVQAE